MRARYGDPFMCSPQSIRLCRQPKTIVLCAIVIGTLLTATLRPTSAATEVRGELSGIQLRVENSSTKEVLDALSTKFNLTYKLPPNTNRNVSGLYSGSLRQVLSRILDGIDYIVTTFDGGLEVVVLGASGATASAVPGTPIARVEAPAAPVVSPPQPSTPVSAGALPPAAPIVPATSSPPPLASYLSTPSNGR
jgi:hypothetical protein